MLRVARVVVSGGEMLWKAWLLAAGAVLGGAAGVLAPLPPAWMEARARLVGASAGVGAALLLVLGLVLARRHDDDPDRGWHLARAASVAFAGLPFLRAHEHALLPGPAALWLALLAVAVMGSMLWRGAWASGPAGALPATASHALGWLVAGALLAFGSAPALGSLGREIASPTEPQSAAVLDLDARVATRALPRCGSELREVRPLLDRGAHPRATLDGAWLWIDALTQDGTRQVHRVERATGRVQCWTCGEPGDNVRPSPSPGGAGVLFETNRFATHLEPANTELMLATGTGAEPLHDARRITVSAGPDDHALFGPTPEILVWSRGEDGRRDVVTAVLRSGHGGLLLGTPQTIVAGQGAWAAPLALAIDARSIVYVRGNPLRPLAARSLDLATGTIAELGADVAPGASAGFNADGGWLALATTRRTEPLGLVPARLGGWIAARRPDTGEARFAGTGLRAGEPFAEGGALALPDELASWGEPTGVAPAPDGTSIVLAQRRAAGDAVEERLVELVLDCRP